MKNIILSISLGSIYIRHNTKYFYNKQLNYTRQDLKKKIPKEYHACLDLQSIIKITDYIDSKVLENIITLLIEIIFPFILYDLQGKRSNPNVLLFYQF